MLTRRTEKLLLVSPFIILALLLTGNNKSALQERHLQTPPLAPDAVLTCKSGARPYREKGIRLEPEYWQNKLIIHDYGHGGSGISLSWGSARVGVEILEREIAHGFQPISKEAAILGSGIIGLTTAHLLADRGWQVHVYASQFPPHTTSNIAPGLWSKVLVGGDQSKSQQKLLEKVLRLSFKDFKDLAESAHPEFNGVSFIDIYTFKEDPPISHLPKGLVPQGIPILAIFDNKIKKRGMQFQSLLVDTSIYIPDLYEKAKAKGVQFIPMTFQTKEDLAHLKQNILFNCTGLGSAHLFHDPSLIPVAGQLIELKAQEGLNYILAAPPQGGLDLYVIPIHNKIILGGSYEVNVNPQQPNLQLCEQILENAREFFSK
jgi:hypothetical protein